MKYYHITMETRTHSKRTYLVSLDKTEEEVRRLAESLAKKSEVQLEGKNIHPSQICRISLFRTAKPSVELILPNGRSIADYKKSECRLSGCCKHRYISGCLGKGRIMEVDDCTKEFMTIRRSAQRD